MKTIQTTLRLDLRIIYILVTKSVRVLKVQMNKMCYDFKYEKIYRYIHGTGVVYRRMDEEAGGGA